MLILGGKKTASLSPQWGTFDRSLLGTEQQERRDVCACGTCVYSGVLLTLCESVFGYLRKEKDKLSFSLKLSQHLLNFWLKTMSLKCEGFHNFLNGAPRFRDLLKISLLDFISQSRNNASWHSGMQRRHTQPNEQLYENTFVIDRCLKQNSHSWLSSQQSNFRRQAST